MTWLERLWSQIRAPREPAVVSLRTPTRAQQVRRAQQLQRAYYTAADVGRLRLDWQGGLRPADDEVRSELTTLRGRSRELHRNSGKVARYVQLIEEQVIGPTGFTLQAKHTNRQGRFLDAENAAIEAAWQAWANDPAACDRLGRQTLTELLMAMASARAIDGETLLWIHEGDPQSPYRFTVQVLNADFLDETYTEDFGTGRRVVQGVEMDATGRRVAYHVWTRHPNAFGDPREKTRVRVSARDLWHLYVPRRVGQTRGVPELVPVMDTLNDIRGYTKATLVAARLAASKMGTITTDPTKAGVYDADDVEDEMVEADPGRFWKLRPGEEANLWDPTYPPVGYGEFTRALDHDYAAGTGASYTSITGDLSQANYSSARVGLLPERDHYRREQHWWITHALRPLYARWLPWALVTGKLALPSLDASRWQTVTFRPRGFAWVDPEKELQAAALAVAMGLKTRSDLVAEQGGDFEDNILALARENAFAQANGVALSLSVTPTAPPAAAPADPNAARGVSLAFHGLNGTREALVTALRTVQESSHD